MDDGDDLGASATTSWVDGSNDLTLRWGTALESATGWVISGACAWPLLALLASGADGDGLLELETAIGLGSGDAIHHAIALIDTLRGSPSTSAALGVWVAERVGLRADWASLLPSGTVEPLIGDGSDQAALDRWASAETDGIIDSCPVSVTPSTEMVLMAALLVRATWAHSFTDGPMTWSTRPDGDTVSGLRRLNGDVDAAAVIEHEGRAYGRVVCVGDGDVDVHLVSGEPDDDAGSVLAAGIAAVRRAHLAVAATAMPVGTIAGCVRVVEVSGPDEREDLMIRLPRFDLEADHDLLRHAEVFGLATVSDASRGHFPGIAEQPLAVGAAAQRIRATFSAEGFVAAAVTAIAMRLGAAMPTESHLHRRIVADHDRPFAFLAVHRPTGLVLVAGWLADPGSSAAG